MGTRRRIAPYPWATLERVPRRVARCSGELRRRIERGARFGGLAAALGELLGSEVSLTLREVRAIDRLSRRHPCRIAIELADATARALVEVEPALATAALARLLGRSVAVGPSGAPVDPALAGALSAILVEAARRTSPELPLRVLSALEPGPESLAVLATLSLDGRPYDVCAIVELGAAPEPSPSLDALGDVPIGLRLVVGAASFGRDELATLRRGDAWLAGAGFWIDRSLIGRAALAAPGGERAIGVELLPGGAVVVRGTERIALEVETMSEDLSDAVQDVALDAPLVVRVELGSVSMTAREWAALRPGDVIESGRRIAEPVTLRIAGQVVARGELVDVEGELGVRVRELVSGGEIG